MENYIVIKDYSKTIKDIKILDNINLSFNKGKIYGIKGRNGSGKTMLLRAICGLIYPDVGEVIINEENITQAKVIPKSIGAIIDSVGFLPYLSGYENLEILAKIKNEIDSDKIKDTMRKVGLDTEERKKVRAYSLGMRQKLAIAQAIMEEPELLVLDEPTNGLDENSVKTFYDIIRDYKSKNATIILTNHNYEELKEICDEIITIDRGTIQSY